MSERKINVLVAEDSPTTRMLLVELLESDPGICVVAAVSDGQAAVEFVEKSKPDVVLMDIHMPVLDGFEATRRIMQTQAVPIVICSAIADTKNVAITFQALQAGALACIDKPVGRAHVDFELTAAHLVQTVKLMSEVKVVRRSIRASSPPPVAPRRDAVRVAADIKLVAIGASTGGPPVLQTILARLPKNLPVPVLVVQHIAKGFLPGMVDWLSRTTSFPVHIATQSTTPLPGHVYIAPDDFHMGMTKSGLISLSPHGMENYVRPAVSFLFRSLITACGTKALAILLTGMGADGAEELKALKDAGALTIAQDRESSVVHGMPGVAIALGGATYVLSPERIADAIVELVNKSAY